MIQHTVKKEEENLRIDKLVSNLLGEEVSRSFLSKNMKEFVFVDGKNVKPSYRLVVGQKVEVEKEDILMKYREELERNDFESNIVAQKGDLDILEETSDYIVLKKKHGVVVHPGIGHYEDTLANYVKQYLLEKGEYDLELKRAGIVHRLDMLVGGLIVFAKNRKFQKHLSSQFEEHSVLKIYIADFEFFDDRVVKKTHDVKMINNVIDDYLNCRELDLSLWEEVVGVMKRDPSNRKRMLFERNVTNEKLRWAKSYLLPIGKKRMCVLIKTGRMHQIRATFRSLGMVIEGDKLYGCKGAETGKISLNSVVLGFNDLSGQKKVFNILDAFNG